MKNIILGILSVLLFTSCTKNFREINTDRNNPTAVTSDLLLSGIISSTLNNQVGEAWSIGNLVVQYNAKIQFVNEDRYGWAELNSIWNNVYGNYRNLQNIFTQVGSNTASPYYGVSLILKSWMFSLVADAYGDAPYSQAGKGKTDAAYQPVYDKQEDIYTGILADLKKANEVLATASGPFSGDLIYGGGPSAIIKWRRLANSLRLRYLLRLSKQKSVSSEMQAILNDPINNPIFTGNLDNAELKYLAAAPNQWPLYGTRVGSFDEIRLSKTFSDRLTALNDSRIRVFGRPTQNSVTAGTPVIQGIPNGLSDVAALAFNGGPQNVSRVGYTFACLVCNDPGQAAPIPDAPRGLLMTYAELQFILAEARQRNFITTGTAATYYNQGIAANFSYWQSVVPAAYNLQIAMPPGYMTQPAVELTGTNTEILSKIALQKWIALYFNGLEAWFDWKRTGLPEIVPGPGNLNNNLVPVRFIYPISEQALNATNRAAAVQRQGADNINTRTWIAK
ncbi:MAG: hypothetical protein RIS12_690 [Bacteroidota bacterium]|jgi:hypothetical protein